MKDDNKKSKIQELRDGSTFCTKAWGAVSIAPSGGVSPCCLFERAIQDENEKPLKIWETELKDIYNNTDIKEIRRKMLAGEKVEECRQCYEVESNGGESLRVQSNFEVGEIIENYNLNSDCLPISLDLKLNNKCNLKCRMCQPKDSHLIHSEFKKIIKSDPLFADFSNANLIDSELQIPLDQVPSWEEENSFFDQLDDLIPSLQKISIVGGEPLLLEPLYRILDRCVELGHAEHIYVSVTTNLMFAPVERLQKYYFKFSKFLYNISLDAIGKELHYIRFPSDFDKILKNFEALYIPNGSWKVEFQFTPTVQVYNILYIHEVYEFVEELLTKGYNLSDRPLHLTYVSYPEHLNFKIVPKEVRERAKVKLLKFRENSIHLKKSLHTFKGLDALIQALDKDFHPESEKLQREFIYYSEALDSSRQQSLGEYLPELKELFHKSKGIKAQAPANFHKIREIGWDYVSKGDYTNSIRCFERSSKMAKDNFLDLRELGWMYLEIKKFKEALEIYHQAYLINQTDKNVLKGLVISSSLAGMKKMASLLMDDALNANPQDNDLLDIKKSL